MTNKLADYNEGLKKYFFKYLKEKPVWSTEDIIELFYKSSTEAITDIMNYDLEECR